jgi:hypothetical protein
VIGGKGRVGEARPSFDVPELVAGEHESGAKDLQGGGPFARRDSGM